MQERAVNTFERFLTGAVLSGSVAIGNIACSSVDHHEYNGPAVVVEEGVRVADKQSGIGYCGRLAASVTVMPKGQAYMEGPIKGGAFDQAGNRLEFDPQVIPLQEGHSCDTDTIYILKGYTSPAPQPPTPGN